MRISSLHAARAAYKPKMPTIFSSPFKMVQGEPALPANDAQQIQKLFPRTYGMPRLHPEPDPTPQQHAPVNVGVILSGGQAPGGHNVISGLFDGIKRINPDSRLYGFLMGPSGLVEHRYKELTAEVIKPYRNIGGFDMIGSGRTKLESKDQFDRGLEILKELKINALVIIGGDDSNTNAAVLAEYYAEIGAGVQVIGVPKTIDGDLKGDAIETSFGFDTASKVYSQLIGNIQRDCASSQKYWHFMKLMGRSASHIALECAMECQPNVCIISEEIEAEKITLTEIADCIAKIVAARAENGLNFGSVIIPEGLIEFIPAFRDLIDELNDLLARSGEQFTGLKSEDEQREFVITNLSKKNAATYQVLPPKVAKQLTLDRDPHGNVLVSLIETERLISSLVERRLNEMKAKGEYKGTFHAMHHFFGYEGRCNDPTNFDANYCYCLGFNAAALIASGVTGYMSAIEHLIRRPEHWVPAGVPITMLMNMERRSGQEKPVIKKALVDLNGKPFQYFAQHRDDWSYNTAFTFPGPIQYFGPENVCDQPSMTLYLEQGGHVDD